MDYYSKVLIPFVKRLIRDHHKYSSDGYEMNIDVLCGTDIAKFAMHLFEYDDRDMSFLSQTDDVSSCLIKLLNNENETNHSDLSIVIKDRLIINYLPRMQALVDDQIGWVEREDYTEMGYRSHQDKSNGESRWIRP